MEVPFPVPASLASGLVLSPMTHADTDAAAVVYHESFGADPANTYWWPKDLAPLLAWCSGRMRIKLDDPFVRIFKITDSATGEMVAYARWDIPKDSAGFGAWIGGENGKVDVTALVESDDQTATANDELTKQQPLTSDDKAAPAVGDYPEGGNHEIADMFFSALGESQKKWKTDDMLGLSLLCVSPRYHRRGIATALLTPMLDIADAEGRKTYLEATAAGRPLYERLGFREVEVLRFDFDALTKERNGLYKNFVMIREPVAKS
ncbi:Acyl-CoA N-acyltransferase [Apiospora marii]|uniref:Acyl-CoA N-acyltransferase n=1 Tax=Apiospora marii TaxID=335849 RepID=UPI00312DCF3D